MVLTLTSLYRHCLERVLTGNGTYRFKITCVAGVQYVDLLQRLIYLAFPGQKTSLLGFAEKDKEEEGRKGRGRGRGRGRGKVGVKEDEGRMEVTTKLWEHQQQTVDKVPFSLIPSLLLFFIDLFYF